MRIMVIGGAGYIGSVVTDQLIERGHEVLVFDSLVQGHRAAVHPRADFVHGDIADLPTLDKAFRSRPLDAVVDLAGETIVTDSMTNPYKYFRKNVVENLNVLECMVQCGVPRIVFSSSSAVYGEPKVVPMPEDHPTEPGNSYGESKLIFERILKWYGRAFGIRFGALRYFNAAGASARRGEDHRPETHLIPLVLRVAAGRTQSISVFGTDYPTPDGTCIRGYTHVEDLARAHVLVLENLDRLGSRCYNVGTLRGFSVREVIEAARRVTGHPIPEVAAPRRPGDVSVMVADASRLRAELSWRPTHEDIESMIRTDWEWRQANPRGYPD